MDTSCWGSVVECYYLSLHLKIHIHPESRTRGGHGSRTRGGSGGVCTAADCCPGRSINGIGAHTQSCRYISAPCRKKKRNEKVISSPSFERPVSFLMEDGVVRLLLMPQLKKTSSSSFSFSFSSCCIIDHPGA